jgi:hypothetical protein
MFPKAYSGTVQLVDLRIAIEVTRIDPPVGSIWCERPSCDGESLGQGRAFAGWLELLALLQALVEGEPDETVP